MCYIPRYMHSGRKSRGLASLVPIPPLPLTKWPRKRWSGIFGPIPWLAIPNNSGQSDRRLITCPPKTRETVETLGLIIFGLCNIPRHRSSYSDECLTASLGSSILSHNDAPHQQRCRPNSSQAGKRNISRYFCTHNKTLDSCTAVDIARTERSKLQSCLSVLLVRRYKLDPSH